MCSRGQPNIGWRPLPYRVIALTLPHFLGNAAKKVFDLYKLSGCDFDALNTHTLSVGKSLQRYVC